MKLSKITRILAIGVSSCVSFAAFAAESSPKTPKEVCEALIEATKKDDFKTVQMYTYHRHGHQKMGGHHGHSHDMQQGGEVAGAKQDREMKRRERNFKEMRRNNMETLKDMSCGSEHVATDHAMVEAEAKGSKVFVPFVKIEGRWLFDAPTYMTFYRGKMHQAREKSAS